MGSNAAPEEDAVSERWDRVLRALSEQPRRHLLLTLANEPPGARLTLPEAALSGHYDDSLRNLEISLRHQHLPVLDDAGYVEWEETPFRAVRGPNFEEAASVVTALVESAGDLSETLVVGCEPLERRAQPGQR
jgi:hypothetical protein